MQRQSRKVVRISFVRPSSPCSVTLPLSGVKSSCLFSPARSSSLNACYASDSCFEFSACKSPSIPPSLGIVVVLFLINALFVSAPRRCGSRDRGRRQHLWHTFKLLALPLDLANALAALAADVFGQLDQTQDIFLLSVSANGLAGTSARQQLT